MNCFADWMYFFEFGWTHIVSWTILQELAGYDHLLFILALSVVYRLDQWKEMLTLITAFTVGHCATLMLTVFGYVSFPREYVEILIPFTIFITAISHLRSKKTLQNERLTYLFVLIFGFIHGMAFAYDFSLMFGQDGCLWARILSFNLGIEIAQIVVVLAAMLLSAIFLRVFKIDPIKWRQATSAIIAALAAILIIQGLTN